jgi:hypothetical protein
LQVDIEFHTWKKLTNLLLDEQDSYDAVIRRLLEPGSVPKVSSGPESTASKGSPVEASGGAYFKDVFLPEGTELRATHKGKTYFAKISGSKWIDQESGEPRSSPSQAAYFITDNHVNGWLFWLVRRPGDEVWHSLNALRAHRL